MSTLKPNRLDQLSSQLKEEVIKLLPKTINTTEKGLYHLVDVKSIPDIVKEEFTYKIRVIKYNQKSYEASKTHFSSLGMTNVHILHDPVIAENEDKLKAKLKAKLKIVNALNKEDLIARATEEGIEVKKDDTVAILKEKIKKSITG